jgi:transposase
VRRIGGAYVLALHRARQGFIEERTAQANQIRGVLLEFGIVIPQGIRHIDRCVPGILESAENELSVSFRQLLARLTEHLRELYRQVEEIEAEVKRWHEDNEASCKLAAIPGIGPLTASALVASVGDARAFRNGRQLAAWMGLVPRQHSSGGKPTLLGISKRGDTYLPTLLIHGARSVIARVKGKAGHEKSWLGQLLARRHSNIAACAAEGGFRTLKWPVSGTRCVDSAPPIP